MSRRKKTCRTCKQLIDRVEHLEQENQRLNQDLETGNEALLFWLGRFQEVRALLLKERQSRRGKGRAKCDRDARIIDLHFERKLSYGRIVKLHPQYDRKIIERVCSEERKRREEEQRLQEMQQRMDNVAKDISPWVFNLLRHKGIIE